MSCIIVAGGNKPGPGGSTKSVEVLFGDLRTKQLANLPGKIVESSMFLHDGTILLCGGSYNGQKCIRLDHGTWKEHSTLNEARYGHSAVTVQIATFLFGGSHSRETFEYLPKGSNTWLMGKKEIPGGFLHGCAIGVKADKEIWLIGGMDNEKRILSFNVNDHTFEELPFQLNLGRRVHNCAFIPNTNKVMITGGVDEDHYDSTEILDIGNGTVTMASHMGSKRCTHGMGVLTINGEDRLAVFGGYCNKRTMLNSVETYNCQTEKWERSDIKLNARKSNFGFLTVKSSNILSALLCTKSKTKQLDADSE